ncbi:MAG: hypothetical protein JSU63_00250 [Phycisphaerales bacterium]|nr:MAG: hypothetical protein JSU63_00250 [Phycisphaerales bacterium]
MGDDAHSQSHPSRWTRYDTLESLALFVIGAVLMNFIHAGSGGASGDELGVAGHDSFYHIKQAVLIPQHGLVDNLPWLRYTYFTEEGDNFVNHHYGFHVLLVPFVTLSHYLTGDYLPGGRWEAGTTFGIAVVLFNLLLISGRVRWRWLWLLFFLLMPFQFFSRHAFVRAISPSLMLMLFLTLMILRRNYKLAGLAVLLYTHLYLGGVIYAPLLVILYVLASIVGLQGEREIPWRLVGWTLAGWTIGVLTHPYAGGMVEFLRLQVFGSGLSPDIEVGREWKPYQNVWWFAQMTGNILLICAIALCLRLRLGRRLNAGELFLLLVNFAFLLLTLKARRFIEYWPVFGLLGAAYLTAPLVQQLTNWFEQTVEPNAWERRSWMWSSTLTLAFACIVFFFNAACWTQIEPFLVEWRVWGALTAVYMLVPFCRVWLAAPIAKSGPATLLPALAVLLCGVLAVGSVVLLGHSWVDSPETPTRLVIGVVGWIALLMLYLAGIVVCCEPPKGARARGLARRGVDSARIILLGLTFLAAVACFAGPGLAEAQRKAQCKYDLAAVRGAMSFIRENSDAGDVIFTDDWDIFPVFYYYNSHNHYVVGLDPKFTHFRRPALWERYVKITRGNVPADVTVKMRDESGKEVAELIHVTLEDIRDQFGARFVITDQDHTSLARKLAKADNLAQLVYPSTSYEDSRGEPYLVFRIGREDGASTSSGAED